MKSPRPMPSQFIRFLGFLCLLSTVAAAPADPERFAAELLSATGVSGGFVVHLGCGDGTLTAALRAGDAYQVQGLDRDRANVEEARAHLQSRGLYGPVCVDQLRGDRLPYIDQLVNLVVAEDLGTIAPAEVMRVLCPNGVAYLKQGGTWTKTVKPRPEAIDDWTHYLHDPSNNAVSDDTVVAPPRRLQWVGSPHYGRHHDRMSSLSAAVSAGGRIFYMLDEGSRFSILLDPKWSLIARDAFNGTILWKQPMGKWHTHLWPLKSGPAQLPRRLVAGGDRVYATLSLDAPLTALDAATGKLLTTYAGTKATEEVLLSSGVLLALVNPRMAEPEFADLGAINRAYGARFWDEAPRQIVALKAHSGEILWSVEKTVLPATLAATPQGVFFHDGESVVCLNRDSGQQVWRSEPVARADMILSFYLPTLVVQEDVVLFSGGETAGKQTGSWYTSGTDTLTALSAETGKILWKAYHPPSGYRSPEDVLVLKGTVWTGETTSGRVRGVFTGRDLHTGEVKSEFAPDVDVYWFHHRCYRGKATVNYLLMARAGTEFIDVRQEQWVPHHWFRGACLYGVMPANGLIYAPPSPCACYQESKLTGFNALAPALPGRRIPPTVAADTRLEPGKAGATTTDPVSDIPVASDWPTYRHDAARSGQASTKVPVELRRAWQTPVGGRLTSPVIAAGKLYVASVDRHTLHALDAASGKPLWTYTAGGRIDSPPTLHQGRVLFGSTDGWVYCLRASDGALLWRFLAAPQDERLLAFEQLESVWPVPGSVLVQNDMLYCVAGRSMFLEGGLRLWRLDPLTGRALSETVLDDRDPAADRDLHSYVSWLNMPPALPDILSSDGRQIYMRSQPFRLDGSRLPLKKFPRGADADQGAPPAIQNPEDAHLFSPTGFLDDSWWHRTYWMYGSMFVSGWSGYYLAGKNAPAGRILVFDGAKVYGYGRKPQYFRWTTPIEHQLFSAARRMPQPDDAASARQGESRVRVAKSKSLDPTGKPLTVEAWVRAEKPDGVILARGGASHGYALWLDDRRPHFALRMNSALCAVAAPESVGKDWVHLAGVLTPEKQLRLYVDGNLAASTNAPGLVTADPAEAMEIGADEGSIVGDYAGLFPFTGVIDEVQVFHRALPEATVARHASAPREPSDDTTELVLRFSFDKGDASDDSGRGNHGQVAGAMPVEGRVGRALKFTGGSSAPPDFRVAHDWTVDLPLFARAMVLSDQTLFVAGPPDLLDEPRAFRQINDPKVRQLLGDQESALAGRKGALLLAIATAGGGTQARYDLDSPPVFDGMAAARERLYVATTTGEVLCFAAAR